MNIKINYQAINKGTGTELPVYAFINYGFKEFDVIKQTYIYKPIKYFTGLKVDSKDWDKSSNSPMSNENKAKFDTIVSIIDETVKFFIFNSNGQIYPEVLKKELDKRVKRKEDKPVISKVRLVDHIRNFMEKTPKYKKKTQDNYRSFGNTLERFEKEIGRKIYSNDFNAELFRQLIAFVRTSPRMKKINSVWTVQKDIRRVLNSIKEEYKISTINFENDIPEEQKIKNVNIDAVYLAFEQIKAIIQYKPKDKEMKNVKLLLMILLFSGCRESDVYKVKPEFTHSKSGETFRYARFLTGKTDTEVIIPILKPLEDALKENGGNLPYKMTQMEFNLKVKQLAKACELNHEITLVYVDKENKRQFVKGAFHEFVSSHIGRRSFITNLINFVPVTILAKITGHKLTNNDVIFNYNKVSLIDNAVRFVKMLRQSASQYPDEFPFKLV